MLKLLSLLGVISYTVEGGNEPQISIRVNSPDRIRQIATGRIVYYNKYVQRARQKHERALTILKYFFEHLQADEERWNFIEEYFLGNDVLSEINETMRYDEEEEEKVAAKPLKDSIELGSGMKLIGTYKDWLEFGKDALDGQPDNEKYLYMFRRLNDAGVRLPDLASPTIAVKKKREKKIPALFAYVEENVLILPETATHEAWELCREMGWKGISVNDIQDDASIVEKVLNGEDISEN